MNEYDIFFQKQLKIWPLAQANYASQQKALYKDFVYSDFCRIRLICLPDRIGSSSAKITAKGVANRPCFLCTHHLPMEQIGWPAGDFQILVNPFPVFPKHFTIAALEHQPQTLCKYIDALFDFAHQMQDFVLFYNGGACGASAPDHLHFQAGIKGCMPIEQDYEQWLPKAGKLILEKKLPWNQTEQTSPQKALSKEDNLRIEENHTSMDNSLKVYELSHFLRSGWVIEGSSKETAQDTCMQLMQCFDSQIAAETTSPHSTCLDSKAFLSADGKPLHAEDKVNMLVWYKNEKYICVLFPRLRHRPNCFYAEGEAQHITSPASVEMGGYYILPRPEDFKSITQAELAQIYSEVCLPENSVNEISQAFLKQIQSRES